MNEEAKIARKLYTLETLIHGKWIVASRQWSAVERDAFLRAFPNRTDIRFVESR